ncbi:MAG: MotA/TolQ/ExbB proton channel family protein [Actinobacteria bacterium]|nr:MotA/TolQ/ExbB proton channel family protein [Actinomycetota bacterium]
MSGSQIENIVFHVANLLRYPVLIATLFALLLVLAELGSFAVELYRRRSRSPLVLQGNARAARAALDQGNVERAERALDFVASSASMPLAVRELIASARSGPQALSSMAKCLADFDLRSMRRLERTRVLVRFGPALGLMGTLIPLSPALSGLASGNTAQLTSNLRVAFSVTVLGLLIGATAFAISLVRDRLYAQDLSDLEVIATFLDPAAQIDLSSVKMIEHEKVLEGELV